MKMPFGKYWEEEISDIPTGYLWWLIENTEFKLDTSLSEAIEVELERREDD